VQQHEDPPGLPSVLQRLVELELELRQLRRHRGVEDHHQLVGMTDRTLQPAGPTGMDLVDDDGGRELQLVEPGAQPQHAGTVGVGVGDPGPTEFGVERANRQVLLESVEVVLLDRREGRTRSQRNKDVHQRRSPTRSPTGRR
jgi:hypothetical protein